MITLREIWIYPVKALCGLRVPEARVEERGLAGDRRFMVVDPNGRFVTQRERPELARLVPRFEGDELVIEAPGGQLRVPREGGSADPPLTTCIWGDEVPARDAGEAAAAFLGDFLGAPHRLARMPETTRRPADPADARPGDLVAFQDGFPFLVASQSSLEWLNARLDAPVDMRRFRPNLVVEGEEAFAEDRWERLRIGEIVLHVAKACPRCPVVDVDPDRGERGRGVLSKLAEHRTIDRAARFGQNCVHDGTGTLREGDPVSLG
ncbi:MAG: MOSC domain-containing protein [Myxococcales bacterium]|nr:MOSC domain-containing protein [Myxococcales bacterium]